MKKTTPGMTMMQLARNNDAYNMFWNTPNDATEILKNYKAAVAGCKSTLKYLKEARTDNSGRIIPLPGFRASCTTTKKDFVRDQEKRLKFLTDENDMMKMVEVGALNKYIYDVIKREIFDKKKKLETMK